MTTTDLLASAAITLSLTATLACLIAMPVLFQKGSDLRFELTEGMDEFKVITDESWEKMMYVRNSKQIKSRPARQIGHCHCYDRKYIYLLNRLRLSAKGFLSISDKSLINP